MRWLPLLLLGACHINFGGFSLLPKTEAQQQSVRDYGPASVNGVLCAGLTIVGGDVDDWIKKPAEVPVVDAGPPRPKLQCKGAFELVPPHDCSRAELEWALRPYPGFDRADWERELAALTMGIPVETLIDHPPFAARAGSALVVVTHDPMVAERLGRRVALEGGRLAA